MPITVNTNVSSLNAQRSLNKTSTMMNKALERLASGLRINHAGDDAAGLAISESLNSQVRGLNQAARNAGDGLSMVGVAEGAIGQTTDILQRIRELAVQSANDINNSTNRQAIQTEIDAQISEISRIANTTDFNGSSLLNGSFSNKNLQIGANSGQTITVSMIDFRATAIGRVAVKTGSPITISGVGTAIVGNGDVQLNGVSTGASTGLDTVSEAAFADQSAIAKAAAINAVSGQSNVSATVGAATVTGAVVAAQANLGSAVIYLKINGIDIFGAGAAAITVTANDGTGTLVNRINGKSNQTGVTAAINAGKVVLTAADGRNIHTSVLGATAASGSGFAAGDLYYGGTLKLTSDTAFSVISGATTQLGMTTTNDAVAIDNTTSLSAIDVTSSAGAQTAIEYIDAALAQASKARSALGAITNRLENTITNLQTTVENMSASMSRIKDADFATETANMTKAQILQQAGVAVLSQANTSPQAALTLLKG